MQRARGIMFGQLRLSFEMKVSGGFRFEFWVREVLVSKGSLVVRSAVHNFVLEIGV